MPEPSTVLRNHALAIWQAAVDAAQPDDLLRRALQDPSQSLFQAIRAAPRVLVAGAGKAGAAMSLAVENILADCLPRLEGVVNVPAECVRPLQRIQLVAARPSGTNQPTAAGVDGALRILELMRRARPQDVALCLLSGGGSALLPAPVEGVSLADKQQVTFMLHACGATINEMNAVRKHLSQIKGGRLAQSFTGHALFSLIISDVIGDPLDVIASGPTAADPTTFQDALAVFAKYDLTAQVPSTVRAHLERGASGMIPETPKVLPASVANLIVGNNAKALAAAHAKAEQCGYRVLNLGSFIEGETQAVATAFAGIVRSIRSDARPFGPPVCLLSGGETTVTLTPNHGRGGRNQEFVLAALCKLGPDDLGQALILSGGTDGEDGPTDAAGALADQETWRKARSLILDPTDFLKRHDAYHFFKATDDLIKTGLTQTNVMDVRVILLGSSQNSGSLFNRL
jgi:hydroxypyruvate reductase/glycerate 2-kinase